MQALLDGFSFPLIWALVRSLLVSMMLRMQMAHHGSECLGLLRSPNKISVHLILRLAPQMARVMLALKTVLAEADATPLLVFDEVDAKHYGNLAR